MMRDCIESYPSRAVIQLSPRRSISFSYIHSSTNWTSCLRINFHLLTYFGCSMIIPLEPTLRGSQNTGSIPSSFYNWSRMLYNQMERYACLSSNASTSSRFSRTSLRIRLSRAHPNIRGSWTPTWRQALSVLLPP